MEEILGTDRREIGGRDEALGVFSLSKGSSSPWKPSSLSSGRGRLGDLRPRELRVGVEADDGSVGISLQSCLVPDQLGRGLALQCFVRSPCRAMTESSQPQMNSSSDSVAG